MKNKWHEIWEKRQGNSDILENGNKQEIFLELKRINGFDVLDGGIAYEQLYLQYTQTKRELEYCPQLGSYPLQSIFEVGCGCGANLYLFQKDGIGGVGGIDYSQALIEIATTVLEAPIELICGEAVNMPQDIQYDAVLSNSVFSYFDSYEYAERVLLAMHQKARHSIGILDIHDMDKKDAFLAFRKASIKDYEERYRDLPKFFYDKNFFVEFAKKQNMDIRFTKSPMKDYWNSDFVFDCYMFKRG